MRVVLLLTVLIFSGCGYNRVYYKSMNEVSQAFDVQTVKVKRINSPSHQYDGYFEVRYKPF